MFVANALLRARCANGDRKSSYREPEKWEMHFFSVKQDDGYQVLRFICASAVMLHSFSVLIARG